MNASKTHTSWSQRYGAKHALKRVTPPPGIAPLRRVRAYLRGEHYVLQWWEPTAKTNYCCRIDGDLLAALAKAREIDERLVHQNTSGMITGRLHHRALVDAYIADLGRRVEAGEISEGTAARYRSALQAYLDFVANPTVERRFPSANAINREFVLEFTAFLRGRSVTGNGRVNGHRHAMKTVTYALSVARALYAWALDTDRGHLLTLQKNPFLGVAVRRPLADMACEPDITTGMITEFLAECDPYQLQLFALLVIYGLRASEPAFLFCEFVENDWLRVPSVPQLDYLTKGRRDKRFPLIGEFGKYLAEAVAQRRGVLFLRREALVNPGAFPLLGASLADLADEYRNRVKQARSTRERLKHRDAIMREAGAIDYDAIEREFNVLKKKLRWPAPATLKDFRHAWATAMANAAMPEAYRRYLLGHAPPRAAAFSYTHLNAVQRHYTQAMASEMGDVLRVLDKRFAEAGGQR